MEEDDDDVPITVGMEDFWTGNRPDRISHITSCPLLHPPIINAGSVGWKHPDVTDDPQVKICSGRFGNMGDQINANPSDCNSPLLGVNDDEIVVSLFGITDATAI